MLWDGNGAKNKGEGPLLLPMVQFSLGFWRDKPKWKQACAWLVCVP